MPLPTITISVKEGDFVYLGARADGSANWKFLRHRKDGRTYPGRVPRRWEKILNREQEKQREREAEQTSARQ